jgi:hypothetical protein
MRGLFPGVYVQLIEAPSPAPPAHAAPKAKPSPAISGPPKGAVKVQYRMRLQVVGQEQRPNIASLARLDVHGLSPGPERLRRSDKGSRSLARALHVLPDTFSTWANRNLIILCRAPARSRCPLRAAVASPQVASRSRRPSRSLVPRSLRLRAWAARSLPRAWSIREASRHQAAARFPRDPRDRRAMRLIQSVSLRPVDCTSETFPSLVKKHFFFVCSW